MAEATRWGKDSVIIRHRLEKLPPNPEIDSPARERASVRNPLSLPPPTLRHPLVRISFFFLQPLEEKKGGEEKVESLRVPFLLARYPTPRDHAVVVLRK